MDVSMWMIWNVHMSMSHLGKELLQFGSYCTSYAHEKWFFYTDEEWWLLCIYMNKIVTLCLKISWIENRAIMFKYIVSKDTDDNKAYIPWDKEAANGWAWTWILADASNMSHFRQRTNTEK